MMLDELQLRNYAQNTIRHYVRTVEDFARRFNCSPNRLGPRHVREYQAELFRKGKSAGTVRQRLAAPRGSSQSPAARHNRVCSPAQPRHASISSLLTIE